MERPSRDPTILVSRANTFLSLKFASEQNGLSEGQHFSFLDNIYRGYYTVARRYGFYFRVVKTIFYERAQRVSKILFLVMRK